MQHYEAETKRLQRSVSELAAKRVTSEREIAKQVLLLILTLTPTLTRTLTVTLALTLTLTPSRASGSSACAPL